MASISLSLYTLRIRQGYSKDFLPLDNFGGNQDLHYLISEYMKNRSANYHNDEGNQHLFRISDLANPGRSFKGKVQKGDYGYQADIVSKSDFKVAHVKKLDEAEMFPFYFYMAIPKDSTVGVLALQRYGQRGTKTYFTFDLITHFRSQAGTMILDIEPLIPTALLQEYLKKGRATKLRFVRFGVHSDIADAIKGNHLENEGLTEITVKAKKGRDFPVRGYVEQILKGKRDITTLANFRNFAFNDVKIELDINGVKRTVSLVNSKQLNAEMDITNQVQVDSYGMPEFNSIDAVAKEYIQAAFEQIGVTYNVQ